MIFCRKANFFDEILSHDSDYYEEETLNIRPNNRRIVLKEK